MVHLFEKNYCFAYDGYLTQSHQTCEDSVCKVPKLSYNRLIIETTIDPGSNPAGVYLFYLGNFSCLLYL